MAEKLGAFLIRTGKITETQLGAALERQVIMGGRLGTNLIELGFLTEEDLAGLLSKKLHLPYATAQDFEAIDPEAVKTLPRELAEKYGVMPLKRERRNLWVAMVDPTDLAAVDALGFATGCVIKTAVAPEARIQYALETHYQIGRTLRYISILEEEKKKIRQAEMRGAGKVEETVPAEQEDDTQVTPREETREEAPLLAPVEAPEDVTAEPVSFRETFDTSVKKGAERLLSASDRDEVIATLLSTLSLLFTRVIFFVVKKKTAVAWAAQGQGVDDATVRGLEVSLTEPSVFKTVVEKKDPCEGLLSPLPAHQKFLAAVGAPAAGMPARPAGGFAPHVVLIPLLIKDQVVSLLYCEMPARPAGGPLSGRVSQTELDMAKKLVMKGSMALEIIIRKKKIQEI